MLRQQNRLRGRTLRTSPTNKVKIGRPSVKTDEASIKHRDYMRQWSRNNREQLLDRLRRDRKTNPEKYRDWDRKRYERDKEKRNARSIRWAESNPQKVRAHKTKWRASNAEKTVAQKKLGNALRDKRIQRQPCLMCRSLKVHGHHPDYSKPFDVVWLCSHHHGFVHRMHRQVDRIRDVPM